jgi:MFS family permease
VSIVPGPATDTPESLQEAIDAEVEAIADLDEAPSSAIVLRGPAPTGSLFRNFPFLRLWTAQALSQTANNMVNFALLLRIREIIEHHDLRQANTLTSLEILAFSLPAVFIGPLAGVVADRMDRRALMAITNVVRAVAMALFLIISPSWQVQIILIATYLVTVIFGTAGQFFAPAQGATIPDLVPRSQLISANAMFNLTNTGAQLAGFALLGTLLVKLFGVNAVFLLTLAIFLACAGLIMTLPRSQPNIERVRKASSAQPMQGMWGDMREGLVFIFRDPYLIKAIIHLSIAAMTIQMLAALGPEFVAGTLDLAPEDLLFIVGPAASGVFLGVFLVGPTTRRTERSSVIDWALALAGLMLVLMVATTGLLNWLADPSHQTIVITTAVFAFGLGVCNAYVLIPAQTMLQERSHEHVRARVYATFFTISNTLAFIPIVFAAALADVFGVVVILIWIGILICALGAQSVVRRRIDEGQRWHRLRRRHRDGPESISPRSGRKGMPL